MLKSTPVPAVIRQKEAQSSCPLYAMYRIQPAHFANTRLIRAFKYSNSTPNRCAAGDRENVSLTTAPRQPRSAVSATRNQHVSQKAQLRCACAARAQRKYTSIFITHGAYLYAQRFVPAASAPYTRRGPGRACNARALPAASAILYFSVRRY